MRTRQLLQRAGLPVEPPSVMTVDLFKSLMSVDKKVIGGRGGRGVGRVEVVEPARVWGVLSVGFA